MTAKQQPTNGGQPMRWARLLQLRADNKLKRFIGTNCLALTTFALILLLASIETSDSASLSASGGASKGLQQRTARDRGE